MKPLLTVFLAALFSFAHAQRIQTTPEHVKHVSGKPQEQKTKKVDLSTLNQDSLIKEKLVTLALNNPQLNISDANIRIAQADIDRAKYSWLSSVNAGANFNEFVIRGSTAGNFFPKYNIGFTVPFDIVTRTKREKAVAKENLVISKEQRREKEQAIKSQVLMTYEMYKEKKELVFLKKTSIEYDLSAYEAAKKSYADGDITLDDLNKLHQVYLKQQSELVSQEKDLNVTIIMLEQMIGMPLNEALKLQ